MRATTFFRRLCSSENWPLWLAVLLLISTAFLKPVELERPVYTYQIGFDISQSMNVKDVDVEGIPVTRLEYAKHMAGSLLRKMPCGSHIGWSVFTGRRTLTLITPLEVCEHYAGLVASLDVVDGSMRWSNGSSIGKGIHQIMRAADEFPDKTGILLMTDGQEAPPLEQGQRGLPKTEQFDVTGLLVGVGGLTPMPIPKIDAQGNPDGFWSAEDVVQRQSPAFATGGEELSRRDDERLQTLARLTDLQYLPLESTRSLIQKATEPEFAETRLTPTDIRWIPATLALLLLLWKFVPLARDLALLMPQSQKSV